MNLNDFFEKLDLSSVTKFVDQKHQEDLFLDFKTVSDNHFNKDDKKNFAKALSGFANSAGGIIVWGVDARKNETGIDCACDLKPIDNLGRFMSQLNSFTGEFVNPLVDGVLHKSIPLDGASISGFAVSLIPESDSGPHMAMAGEFRYYKRSGDSFYKLEHHDLEDMFGRRPKPILEPEIQKITGKNAENVKIILGIRNKGREVAKFPFLSINVNTPYRVFTYGLDGNGHHGLPYVFQGTDSPQNKNFGGDYNTVIYPETFYAVTVLTLNEPFSPKIEQIPDLQLNYLIACEGMKPREGQISISSHEINEQLNTS